MSETAQRSKVRVFSEQSAGGFQRVQVTFRYLPASVGHIPLELPLNVGDEIVRLAEAHEAVGFTRARARARMVSKSSLLNGLVGRSADSNSQASNSGVTSKGFCCCSRRDRMIPLTNSLASAQTPARTCSCKNSS